LSWGASKVKKTSDDIGLSSTLNSASQVVKQKADEYKVTEKVTQIGQTTKNAALKTKDVAVNGYVYTKEKTLVAADYTKVKT